MNLTIATEISALLNSRNQLTIAYTAQGVLDHADNYRIRTGGSGEVIACVELKPVQWYQFEVLHLTVAPGHARKGLGRAILADVEIEARRRGARILQCTIRAGNIASEGLFESCGFSKVSSFYNERSGNVVCVWQRVLIPPP